MEKKSGYHYGVLQIPLGLNCIALHMGAGVLVDCVWKLQRRKQMRPIVCLLLGCLLFMKVPGWHSPDKLTNCCLETTRLYIVLGYIPAETDWLYQRIQCFSQSQSDENILLLAVIVFCGLTPDQTNNHRDTRGQIIVWGARWLSSVSQVINHMTCYKFEGSHWLKYSLQSECCSFKQCSHGL